jgi:hypothetical protein
VAHTAATATTTHVFGVASFFGGEVDGDGFVANDQP